MIRERKRPRWRLFRSLPFQEEFLRSNGPFAHYPPEKHISKNLLATREYFPTVLRKQKKLSKVHITKVSPSTALDSKQNFEEDASNNASRK